MYSLISNLFLSLLFDFCETFLGVEAIVVVLHDSLILINILSRSLDFSFSRKDLTKEKQSYNVLILLVHALTAYTFGVIIVLHKTEL